MNEQERREHCIHDWRCIPVEKRVTGRTGTMVRKAENPNVRVIWYCTRCRETEFEILLWQYEQDGERYRRTDR